MAYEKFEDEVAKMVAWAKDHVANGDCDAFATDEFEVRWASHKNAFFYMKRKDKDEIKYMKADLKAFIAQKKNAIATATARVKAKKIESRAQYKAEYNWTCKVQMEAAKRLGIGFKVGETYLLPKKAAATTPPSSSDCLHIVCERLGNDGLVCQSCKRVLRESTGAV